jgi:predicted outer membrane lipoprotein
MVGYSMACAFAIVPYVLVRSVTELADDRDELRELRGIRELLDKAQNPKP